MLDKKNKILLIVESPEKSKTITKIFRDEGYKNVTVVATIGHFTKIADGSGYWNTGIDVTDNFKINYVIDSNKKEQVKKLKDLVKASDFVYICTDPDREGEAIAWSCKKFLGITNSKYKRATYQAINKSAIFEALDNPRLIDENLADAAHARSCLDKMIGYRLSPIARTSINCKSVGRCQSAALKLIADRENEIINFKPEKYIDIYLHFFKNRTEFKAKYVGTEEKSVSKLTDEKEVDKIFSECEKNDYVINNILTVDRYENPKPMFNTTSFQQEVVSKLGLSSKQSMDCAQKLFDAGKISYHRTDDSNCSPEFAKELTKFVKNKFGNDYYSPIKQVAVDENAQQAHECLRVLDLELTPEKFSEENGNTLLQKVYSIIYNRTVAAAMKPAIYAETIYTIANGDYRFQMSSKVLKFDGFKKIYNYSEEENDVVRESFKANERLKDCRLEAVKKQTNPPARYKENTLIGELKDKGIGRPSTYATIIETVLSDSRGYCKLENKFIYPTDKGLELSKFLDNKFPDIINIEYTKKMEDSLDLIAEGKLKYVDYLNSFLHDLDESADKVTNDKSSGSACPKCGKPMVIRKGKYGLFKACSGYPECKYIQGLNKKGN